MFRQSAKLTAAVCLAPFCAATASGASQPPPVTPVLPNDPGRVQFPYVYKQIDAPNFWGATINKTCTVRLAVLDSGIAEIPDLSHVVLRANFAPGVSPAS
jgi:hypothetical protein